MAKVAVLGCGPAGLLAAYAALQGRHTVTVLANRPQRSRLGGAQYLHEPIPGLHRDTTPDLSVSFERRGSREGYAKKVYGRKNAPCSWHAFEDQMSAWRLDYAYDRLWQFMYGRIQTFTATPKSVDGLFLNFDHVLSTVPLISLCHRGHEFSSVEIYVTNGYHARSDIGFVPQGTIIYSGLQADPWYRVSNITGEVQVESAMSVYHRSFALEKPLEHECDCWDEMPFHPLGRYGQWKKGVLVHHAYREARRILGVV